MQTPAVARERRAALSCEGFSASVDGDDDGGTVGRDGGDGAAAAHGDDDAMAEHDDGDGAAADDGDDGGDAASRQGLTTVQPPSFPAPPQPHWRILQAPLPSVKIPDPAENFGVASTCSFGRCLPLRNATPSGSTYQQKDSLHH